MEQIYLKRKIDDYLVRWKQDVERKPLIVKGARQVGKTKSIRRFAEGNYKNVIYINFIEEPKYKLYFFDTGIFVAMLDEEAQEDLRANKNLGVYKGALYENIVGEALIKCGYDLFYYKKDDSYLEEDFFVRTKDYLVPVEVKATNGMAKSLRTLIKSGSYPDIKYGIKFTSGNIGYSDNIYTFPYFCAFLLKDYLKEVSLARESRGRR